MNTQIGLSFGALSEPLSEQLKKQGFKFKEETIKTNQKELDAITQLRFGNQLLTDSMADKLIIKLYRKIISHICKENGIKEIKK